MISLLKKKFIPKLGIFVSVFLLLFSLKANAQVYKIPPDLKAELAKNEEWLKREPESNDARFELAMSYAYTGQIMEGWATLKKLPKEYSELVIAKYEPITKNEPTNWKAPFKLAFGYYFIKKKHDAIPMFEESYRRNPNNIWALGFIAFVHGDMGNTDEAIRVCKVALKKEPNATAIHFLLAEGYRRKGQYGKFLSEMMIVGRLQTEDSLERKNAK